MLLLKLLEDHLTLVRTLLEITPKDGITEEEFSFGQLQPWTYMLRLQHPTSYS